MVKAWCRLRNLTPRVTAVSTGSGSPALSSKALVMISSRARPRISTCGEDMVMSSILRLFENGCALK